MKNCPVSLSEIEVRRKLRERLREACINAPEAKASAEFIERLRKQLQNSASHNKLFGKFKSGIMPVSLAAYLLFGATCGESATRQLYCQGS